MPFTRLQTKNSEKGLKRSSTESNPKSNRVKIPKIVVEETPKENSKILDEMAKRLENLDTKMSKYESSQKNIKNALVSNMESIDGLNSKIDKIGNILNCMKENKELPNENNETQIYYPFYGNIMSCQNFFDTEGLMTNYSMTGRDIMVEILSYLDFETMVKCRLVSKIWYGFLEKERGLWTVLLRKVCEDLMKKMSNSSMKDWKNLSELIIENGDNVADIITLGSIFLNNKKDVVFYYQPALCIYPCLGPKDLSSGLKFLKMLDKYNFLHGLEDRSDASRLICWSLKKVDALELVLNIVKNKFNFELSLYLPQGKPRSPMWYAIREREMALEKVQMLIPFAQKKFWNSGKPVSSVDHTPLADAIMVGNIEVVKAILPYTRIQANPKHRYVSYLHVAVKFGRTEIFEEIFHALKKKKIDWRNLKNRENRTAYDILKDDQFRLCHFTNTGGIWSGIYQASLEDSEDYKKSMLKFIENLVSEFGPFQLNDE